MKLTYRGANYEYDIPTVDMEEGGVAGKYRGQNWNYHYPRHMKVPQHVRDLQYRGRLNSDRVSLKSDRDVAPKFDTIEATVTSAQKVEDVATVHQMNICNILDRRKQVARAKGDVKLMSLLEIEWRQMAC
ncbi:DUF4278 domain-containing protein [Tychonema sp. BBK16]|uniref:DUF4278 domain-containing protein n=1 Tax=Tychonema sp. BBK16 TaxID=2699888 RepID=UPI001F4282CD|nr:DUF4278 domain-containing protein [Tychonema sp. BBK16]MCF6373280.1 DUF4278 domain-containing protein [Tychonema sp. BBK16]